MESTELGRKIAIAMRAKYSDHPWHWEEKAARVLDAASEDEVYRGLLNFDWMADLPKDHQIAKAAKIIWHELRQAFDVGDRVTPSIGRRCKIASVVSTSIGFRSYILDDGGMFSGHELNRCQ